VIAARGRVPQPTPVTLVTDVPFLAGCHDRLGDRTLPIVKWLVTVRENGGGAVPEVVEECRMDRSERRIRRRYWCSLHWRDSAHAPVLQVTDEGIFPMTTHRSILHASMQEKTVSAEGSTGSSRADSIGRTARGVAILALVLGSALGAEAAASSGPGSAGHADALQRPVPSVAKPHMISYRPWMY
jgi:hypothetical protein